jgi:threonine/homoserine/homoserine lactone efflux protein
MTLAALLALWAVHLAAVASPGPAFALGLRLAATEGLRPALIFALGVGLGGAGWALAALTGLSLLFQLAPWTMAMLKLAGGVFLIWIGVQGWRHARDPLPPATPGALPRSSRSALRLALVSQAGNPKTALFFGAVFAALVPADPSPMLMAGLLAMVLATETLWFSLVALTFSRPPVRRAYARMKAGLDRAFGAAMMALGLRLSLTP